MRTALLLFVFTTMLNAQNGISLTFSEIMFNTTSSDNSEFVEIYNTSTTTTVDLSTIKIYYDGGNENFSEYNGDGYSLAPGQYAVIFENDLDIENGVYAGKIDPNALILIRTATTWGLVNSTDKLMEIRNDAGDVLDAYTYSASNTKNYSDEKRSMTKDNSAGNWTDSDSEFGTPGGSNSAPLLQDDLSLKNIIFNPNPVFEGNNLEITIQVSNNGSSNAASFTVNIYEDLNNNSIAEAGELIKTENISNLTAGGVSSVSVTKNGVNESTLNIIGEIVFAADQNTENNSKRESITVFPPQRSYNDLVINEIMYDPESDQPEWIEIYNTSNDDINIKDWSISDAKSTVTISNNNLTIPSNNYFVLVDDNDPNTKYAITSDKLVISLPLLNNDGDEIILKDYADKTIDSVDYKTSWGDADEISLERIIPSGNSNDATNWGVSNAGNGATPGLVNTLSSKQFDVEVASINTSPQYIIDGTDATITVKTKNNGQQTANGVNVIIYNDINNNEVGDAGEEIFNQNYASIASGDSVSSVVVMNALAIGEYQVIAEAVFAGDEFNGNNVKVKSFQVIQTPSAINDIVINEFMFDPNSGEPEWVEIYNRTASAINLKNWKIGDATSSVLISNIDYNLGANEYLVLSGDASVSTIFTIPSNVIVLSLPALNNGGDDIILRDSLSRAIDSVSYSSSWGDDAKSAERIDIDGASNLESNWGASIALLGGTPGGINTLSPKQFDVEVASINTSPQYIIDGNDATITVKTKNNGQQAANAVNVIIYNDINNNDIGDLGEEIFNQNYALISSGDSVNSIVVMNALTIGDYQVIAEAVFAGDEFSGNNIKVKTFEVIPTPSAINDIVINEFMFDPNTGEPEWVEIYNRTGSAINLKNWEIADASSAVTISNVDYNLGANEYLVLSGDASVSTIFTVPSNVIVLSLPALNNSGDDVILRDSLQRAIDSLTYTSDWGDDAISAERRRVGVTSTLNSNWAPSIDAAGGTPGKENSIETKQFDLTFSSFSVLPEIIYTPDSPYIKATVKNIGYDNVGNFDVVLYQDNNKNGIGDAGEEIITKNYNSLNVDDSITISHNLGILNSGDYNYIGKINLGSDQRITNNISSKTINVIFAACSYNDIVINEIMYKPNRGNPEWIELYNRSNKEIDLRRFSLGSTDPSTVITNSRFILPAKGYVVIAEESNLGDEFAVGSEIIVSDLFSLNNTSDEIVLYDDNDRKLDFVSYISNMGGDNYGVSLERISVDKSSGIRSNWNSCEANEGGTPGYLNSTAPLDFDLKVRDVKITNTAPKAGDELMFEYFVVNEGNQISNEYSISIYNDLNFDGITSDDEKVFSNSFAQLYRRTEKKEEYNFTVNGAGTYQYIIELETANDPRLRNNSAIINFSVLPQPANVGDVIISEFMFAPLSGNPEWIEIYNRTDHAIELFNWLIGDEKSRVSLPSFTIPAGGFIIISDKIEQTYAPLASRGIKAQSNIIYVDLPSLNNSGDLVRLFDAYETSIDLVEYSSDWGGENGHSLERLDLSGNANDSSNWMSSKLVGGSAGKKNSVTPELFDLELTELNVIQESPFEKNEIQLSAWITNIGINKVEKFVVQFSISKEGDEKEVIGNVDYTSLASGDSVSLQMEKYVSSFGNYNLMAEILFNLDNDKENNLAQQTITVLKTPNQFGDCVINEIMYDPQSGEAEWVEIYNLTSDDIDLTNWMIGDQSNTVSISDQTTIKSKDYFVIASDTSGLSKFGISKYTIVSMPALNNSGDEVKLFNQYSMIIDSLEYEGSWGEDEKSLERRDALIDANIQSNWRVSTASLGSTPGIENSIVQKDFDLVFSDIKFIRDNNAFNGEGIIEATIFNDGRFISSVYGVEFFDDKNLNSVPDEGERFYGNNFPRLEPNDTNIIRYNYNQAKTGNFKILGRINYSNDQRNDNNLVAAAYKVEESPNKFNDVVINEIMYDPLSGNSEWIEIVNTSEERINLKDWSISDLSSNRTISDEEKWVSPNEYIVLSNSQSVIKEFGVDSTSVIVMSLPSLNNSGDKISLSDQTNNLIDKLEYLDSWGGADGKSLERIGLSGKSQDSTNWQTSFDPNFATPGKINSNPILLADLELSNIVLSSNSLKPTDTLHIDFTIKNIGGKNSTSGNVFYKIIAENIVIEDSTNYTGITAGDSVVINKSFTNLPAGNCSLEILVDNNNDINLENNSDVLSFYVTTTQYAWGDIKINEIMYAPNGDEPEWIELVNTSDKTISLTGWMINDNSSTVGKIDSAVSLEPNEYLVIADERGLEDLYNIESQLIVTSLPSFNNSGDLVKISDGASIAIDTVAYSSSWGGKDGNSLERIFLGQASSDENNWSTSLAPNRATPGGINSIAGGWVDVAITEFSASTEFTILPEKTEFNIKIHNVGISNSGKGAIYLYNDLNNDSLYTNYELLDSIDISQINAGEEKAFSLQVLLQNAGSNRIVAKAVFENDINTENNISDTYHKVIKINELRGDLVINEVMYSPKSGESEWIELYNNSSKTIDLNGYQVQDSRSSAVVVDKNIFLQPSEYFVIANDSSIFNEFEVESKTVVSSFPSLNNSGETIVILDSLDRVIDSLQFTSDWGGARGISLEKLSPELDPLVMGSWNTANEELRGTPGTINSITTGWIDLEITDISTNSDYTLYPNAIIGFIEIRNHGISKAENSKLYFYKDQNNDSNGSKNELIDSLQIKELNGSGLAQVEFEIANVEIGYSSIITIIENSNDSKIENNQFIFNHRVLNPIEERMDLVINEFMNNPIEGNSEWIELYNQSTNVINLYGYEISDNRSSSTITSDFAIVEPNTFFIIANDSSFINEFNYQEKVLITDFPSLNNTGDDIVITNVLGKVIDSVQYSSSWVGDKGQSIERTSPVGSSTDINNWNVSIAHSGGTPGKNNSYSQRDFDAAISNVIYSPQYPKTGDALSFSITIKNVGKENLNKFTVKILSNGEEIENIQATAIKSNDSLIVKNNNPIILSKETEYVFVINSEQDQAEYNDSLSIKITPSYLPGSVVISEFMFDPFSGEPEWFEIVNNSDDEIDIAEWSASDLLSSPTIRTITYSSTVIKPNEFVVIAADSNVYGINKDAKLFVIRLASLGNSGDGILIYDKTGCVIDSVQYEDDWSQLKGQSVERRTLDAPSNQRDAWIQSISADNATPGYANSVWDISSSEEQSIVINEIMANPNDDNSEFIEVFNRSEEYINIGGWTLTDNSGKSVRISDYSYILPPNNYYAFFADSSALYNYDWLDDEENYQITNSRFALTNSGEELILQDLWGNVIDSLKYDDGWNNSNISFTKNKSLERINPHINSNYGNNWSTCVDNLGATPGKENSIYTERLSDETKLSVSPNPFSPDADGFEDNTIISYNLTQAIAQVRVRVFDSRGRHVRTIESNKASGSRGEIIFNGFDDNSKPLRIGIYVLFIEALNSSNGVVETMKKAVVVARKI